MTLTFLHTSDAQRPTYQALGDRLAPGMEITQHLRPDWLKSARKHGIRQALIDDMAALIHAAPGPVICTCPTLGEAAASLGAIRLDAPMMAEAARIGGPILLVYALKSTETPSLALLDTALQARDLKTPVHPLFIGEFWPLFEAHEYEAFTACVAGAVRHACEQTTFGCVVLAQDVMAPAAPLLQDLGTPVLTAPELAFTHAMAQLTQT